MRALKMGCIALFVAACATDSPPDGDTADIDSVPPAATAVDTGSHRAAADSARDTTAAQAATDPQVAADVKEATDAIRAYYGAIDDHRYAEAYMQWGDNGRSSGQSLMEFTRGFIATSHVAVDVGTPGRIEGAAGSRYIELPVRVTATLTDGTEQHFTGTYVMRRVVVDGATTAQRRWHIDSASLHPS